MEYADELHQKRCMMQFVIHPVVYIAMEALLLLCILGNLHRRRKNGNRVISVVENNCTGCGRCVKKIIIII